MRGRKPKPTAIKRLNGNPGRRPLNEAEPQMLQGGMSCPRHLNDAAKREWRRVVRDLREAGVLARVDRSALEAYCVAYSRWLEAEAEVDRVGITVAGAKGGLIKNPAVTVAGQMMTLMHKFMAELGMTPSSRSRMKLTPMENKPSLADVLFDSIDMEKNESA